MIYGILIIIYNPQQYACMRIHIHIVKVVVTGNFCEASVPWKLLITNTIVIDSDC